LTGLLSQRRLSSAPPRVPVSLPSFSSSFLSSFPPVSLFSLLSRVLVSRNVGKGPAVQPRDQAFSPPLQRVSPHPPRTEIRLPSSKIISFQNGRVNPAVLPRADHDQTSREASKTQSQAKRLVSSIQLLPLPPLPPPLSHLLPLPANGWGFKFYD